MMAFNNAYFILDRTFKKGTDTRAAQRLRSSGGNVSGLYNTAKVSVYLCCSAGKQFIKVNTGIKILPAQWDFSKRSVSRKHPMALELNALLSSILRKADQELITRRLAGEDIPAASARDILCQAIGKPVENNIPMKLTQPLTTAPAAAAVPAETVELGAVMLWQAFHAYVDEHRKLSKPGTVKKYLSLEQILKDFERDRYILDFAKFTLQFLTDFKLYSYETRSHQDNTVGRNIKSLKAFLKWAELHPLRYNQYTDYKRFTASSVEGEVFFLTGAELAQLEGVSCKGHPGKTAALDFFLFQCYTGQRYSDVAALRPGDVAGANAGTHLEWTLYQIKGSKSNATVVPLLDRAEEIYRRYADRRTEGGTLFPSISNILLNKYLKDLAKEAGINAAVTKVGYSGARRIERKEPKWVFVSSHMARRTFVSLSLERGLRPELIRAVTGHTTDKVMKRYVGINRTVLATELRTRWAASGNS